MECFIDPPSRTNKRVIMWLYVFRNESKHYSHKVHCSQLVQANDLSNSFRHCCKHSTPFISINEERSERASQSLKVNQLYSPPSLGEKVHRPTLGILRNGILTCFRGRANKGDQNGTSFLGSPRIVLYPCM